MKCAVALLAAAVMMSVSALHTGAHRPLVKRRPSQATTMPMTDDTARPPTTQANRNANLTAILTLDGPFRTFLGYLQQTNLVEVFQSQAYLTDQGITIFVPVDRAFAAVDPPVLLGLSVQQLKSLMMYHSLPKHYELADFEQLSHTKSVTTLAGGQYTVNVTYDSGTVHVHSRWANAKIVGSVSVDAPMAIYELDRVLLPDALFHAQPPVAEVPNDVPAAPPRSNEDDDGEPFVMPQYGSPGVAADAPVSTYGGDDNGRSACYAAAAALGTVMALVAL